MAFNPLHGFRKHQKTLLAGITIMCMFIFVLQFSTTSGGDFFSEITYRLGGKSRFREVASLYDRAVTDQEMDQLQRQREIANQYIVLAIQTGNNELISRARMMPEFKTDANKQLLDAIERNRFADPRLSMFPEFLQQRAQQLEQLIFRLHGLQREMMGQKNDVAASVIGQLQAMMQQEFRLSMRGNEPYFGGSTRNFNDLLEFKIWLHQADRLGIQLTRRNIKDLVQNEAHRLLTDRGLNSLEEFFRKKYRNASPEAILTALSDEFRVRLAKAALLGYEAQRDSGVPPPFTPYEFWKYFNDQRTESRVAVLPIPVNHAEFLAQAGQPTDDDLKKLFEKHKNREFARDSHEAGFKQPQRSELEWISARPTSPHYVEEANKLALLTRAGLQQLSAGAALAAGGGLAAQGVAAALPVAFDLPLILRYEDSKFRYPAPSWTDPWTLTLHDSSLTQPANVAALVGQLGSVGTGGTHLSGPVAFLSTAFDRETRDRARIWSTLVLSGAGLSPFTAAGMAYAVTPENASLPFALVQDEVREKQQEELARDLVRQNLMEVREELESLSRDRASDVRHKDNVSRPTLVAATLGQVLGAAGTASVGYSPALGASLAFCSVVTAQELKDQANRAAALVLGGATLSPLTVAIREYLEESLPVARARAYMATAIPRYGLEHGKTEKPRDRFTLADDSGLQPLKDSFLRFQPDLKQFDRMFLQAGARPYTPQRWPRLDFASMPPPRTQEDFMRRHRDDEQVWINSERPFLYWKTADWPAYVPTLEEARDKVKQRWQFEKARALAKKEAEQIAAEARKLRGDADRFLKDGSPHSSKLFHLDHVARLQKPLVAFETRQTSNAYNAYKVPDNVIEHPPADLLDKLLALKEPGEVIVFQDKPEGTYYVAALQYRIVPDERAFYEDYSKHAPSLLGRLEQEHQVRQKYRKAVVEKLEQEANLRVLDEEFRKDFETRRGMDDD